MGVQHKCGFLLFACSMQQWRRPVVMQWWCSGDAVLLAEGLESRQAVAAGPWSWQQLTVEEGPGDEPPTCSLPGWLSWLVGTQHKHGFLLLTCSLAAAIAEEEVCIDGAHGTWHDWASQVTGGKQIYMGGGRELSIKWGGGCQPLSFSSTPWVPPWLMVPPPPFKKILDIPWLKSWTPLHRYITGHWAQMEYLQNFTISL